MAPGESKTYQLRVRVTERERELLERLRADRNRDETISDLVRNAIAMLIRPNPDGTSDGGLHLHPSVRAQVDELAVLLKREPHQVEVACVEGILDLIEHRSEIPLIVMETHLHLKYRSKEEAEALSGHGEISPDVRPDEPRRTPVQTVTVKVA